MYALSLAEAGKLYNPALRPPTASLRQPDSNHGALAEAKYIFILAISSSSFIRNLIRRACAFSLSEPLLDDRVHAETLSALDRTWWDSRLSAALRFQPCGLNSYKDTI